MNSVFERKQLLLPIFYLMFFIFTVNSLAQRFFWYSSVWWIDMFMHFLGGFWLGLFFLWFFSIKNLPIFKISLDVNNYKLLVYKIIFFVLIVGILWEFFEFFTFNYFGHDIFNILDTTSDIFFDLAGGIFTALYFLKRIMFRMESAIQ